MAVEAYLAAQVCLQTAAEHFHIHFTDLLYQFQILKHCQAAKDEN